MGVEETLPTWVVAVAAAATVLAAVAQAVRRAILPAWHGVRELARFHGDVVQGAHLAQRELAPDGGASLVDRVEYLWLETQEARRGVLVVDERLDELDRRMIRVEDELGTRPAEEGDGDT